METKIGNTAAKNATPAAERLIRYQTLLALLDALHERGEISEDVRCTAGKLAAMKCGLRQDSIFI